MMTKKDYELMANVYREFAFDVQSKEEDVLLERIVRATSKQFKLHNPRFDETKFYSASRITRSGSSDSAAQEHTTA